MAMIDRQKKKVAVIYTHFPHYRAPIFDAMSHCASYEYTFYYDPVGIEDSIISGAPAENHHSLTLRKWRGFMWQTEAIALARNPKFDGFIFLGNPFILSTWVAAIVARRKGKPVFFWTHGWLRHATGTKAWLRRRFYRLADGLLVYGARARTLGQAEGFDPGSIHVINNSLDYAAQKQARQAVLANPDAAGDELPDKPFFLAVSRLIESVALDKAVEAMARLTSDAALVVVGAGPKREALEAQAEALGVDVRFTGAIYEEARLARLFLGACAVVSPGKVGLLAMHALAYGAPVITHNDLDRQMPEVEAIDPGHTGAFFRYGDVDDLARQMTMFLQYSPKTRAADRTAAIARIEECYTPEAQVTYITAALDTIMRKKA
jgi:glycosyltransferase involved in cell wall biosynthesis